MKKSLRRQLGLPVLKNDAKLEADPFLILGYGMNAYLDVMVQLMKMMGVISIAVLPIIFQLSSFGALSELPKYSISQYSLGNLGGAEVVCV